MGTFQVALKKIVDDSYEIETGRSLAGKLAEDLQAGLMGPLRRFALITDSNVETLYAGAVLSRLLSAGFTGRPSPSPPAIPISASFASPGPFTAQPITATLILSG